MNISEDYKKIYYKLAFLQFGIEAETLDDSIGIWNIPINFRQAFNKYSENRNRKNAKDEFEYTYNNYNYFTKTLDNNNYKVLTEKFKHIKKSQYTSNARYNILDAFKNDGEWLNCEKEFNNIGYPIYTIGMNNNKNTNLKIESLNDLDSDIRVGLIKFQPNTQDVEVVKDILSQALRFSYNGTFLNLIINKYILYDLLELLVEKFNFSDYDISKKPYIFKTNNKDELLLILRHKHENDIETLSGRQKYFSAIGIQNNIESKFNNLSLLDLNNESCFEIYFNLQKYDIRMHFPESSIVSSWEKKDIEELNKIKASLPNINSSNDVCWKWFKEVTALNERAIESVTIPKPFKSGEVINVLASGMISGLIAEGTGRNHIVIGGTKNTRTKKEYVEYDDEGHEIKSIKTEKINKPFVNILLPDGNIKELINDNQEETQDEFIS